MSWTIDYLFEAISKFITSLNWMLFYKTGNLNNPPLYASFADILYRMLFFSIMMWVFKKVMRHG